MPRNNFPVTNRHINEPILVTDIYPTSQADAGSTSSQAGSLPTTTQERTLWRTMGAGVASLAAPVGIGVLHLVFGEVIAVIEVIVVLTIIGMALDGSPALSERAFRLLRWIGNRPEPPNPPLIILAARLGASAPVQDGETPRRHRKHVCRILLQPIRLLHVGRGRQGPGGT